MNNKRIEILKQYLESEPEEPFNRYALALEYLNFDIEKAKQEFEILYQKKPDYLPLYYHLGKLYEDLEQAENAQKIFQQGIELATKIKDEKAKNELQRAYQQSIMNF
jgi:Tfp pilus assembly protein PilF